MSKTLSSALVALLLVGCSASSNPCTAGASAPCACSDGRSGAQVCGADGVFNACMCTVNGTGGGTSAGGGAAGNSAGGVAGGVVGDGGASTVTVVVVLKWVWFESNTTCLGSPVTCGVVNTCPPSNCDCISCSGGAGCLPSTITPKCCTVSATIAEADLSRLVQDYPTCRLTQTSPRTYDLDCPTSSTSNTYWTYDNTKVRGTDHRYAEDAMCRWTLPYAL
jgi:hypothetical protein